MKHDEKRDFLRSYGWRRVDKELHGFEIELWEPPGGGPKLTLLAAYRVQKRESALREPSTKTN